MMHKLQQYMSGIGENMEKEGDAIKEYQSLKSQICDDMHCCRCRLEEQDKYDNNPNPPTNEDGIRIDFPPMTADEIADAKEFLIEAQDLISMLDEIIGDEMNHSLKLLGKMTKYGCVRPGQDGLANAIQEICMTKKAQEDGDDNGSN